MALYTYCFTECFIKVLFCFKTGPILLDKMLRALGYIRFRVESLKILTSFHWKTRVADYRLYSKCRAYGRGGERRGEYEVLHVSWASQSPSGTDGHGDTLPDPAGNRDSSVQSSVSVLDLSRHARQLNVSALVRSAVERTVLVDGPAASTRQD